MQTILPSSLRQRKHQESPRSSLTQDVSEMEDPRSREYCRHHHRGRWIGFGILLFVVAIIAITSPLLLAESCFEVVQCRKAYEKDYDKYPREGVSRIHAHLATFVGTLFLREVVTLGVAFAQENDFRLMSLRMPRSSRSTLLMCVCLLTLCGFQILAAHGHKWVHAVPPLAGFRGSWSYVNSYQYIFWQVEVPILLLLCGHFVLCRPLSEVTPPSIATSAYMYLSWWALIANSLWLRCCLVTCCFLIYIWTTWRVLLWLKRFSTAAPQFFPSRKLRAGFLIWLNVLFAFYGVVYLLEIFDVISTQLSFDLYAICDGTAKAVTCFCLAHFRSAEQSDALGKFVAVSKRTNRAKLSILRTSFDYLIPCRLEDGECYIVDGHNADIAALEKMIGKSLGNVNFAEVLNSYRDRESFKNHMMSALQQEKEDLVREELAIKGAEGMWFEEKLFEQAAAVATVLNYEFRISTCKGMRSVPVSIHVSGAMGHHGMQDGGPHMILALRMQYEGSPEDNQTDNHIAYGAAPSCSNRKDPVTARQNDPSDVASEPNSITSGCANSETMGRADMQHAGSLSFTSFRLTSSGGNSASRGNSASTLRSRRRVMRKDIVQSNRIDSHSSSGQEAVDASTQTINPKLHDVATETSIIWEGQGLRCNYDAKPPIIPGTTSKIYSPRPEPFGSPRSSASRSSHTHQCPNVPLEDFIGTWVIRDAPDGMAPFLKTLRISDDAIFDAHDNKRKLRRLAGAIRYEGGSMHLENDMLIRVGKKGTRYCYVRAQDQEQPNVGGE